jgi:hypothetical protein
MGASGWVERVPWCEDLANALATARARAYERVPISERERAAASSVEDLLTAMDLDLDDDDTVNAFSAWATNAPPESRYAALRGSNGAHSVLDIDRVVTTAPAMTAPSLALGSMLVLSPPEPGLGSVRWATSKELVERYETEHVTEVDGDEWLDGLDRGTAIAVTRWKDDRPFEIVICGVTGD